MAAAEHGTLKLKIDAVDTAGNVACRLRPNQRFTVPVSVSAEFAGEYQIDDITLTPPQRGQGGTVDISYRTYNPNATTDFSDPPDDSLRTIASAQLPKLGVSDYLSNVAWVLQSTFLASGSGSSLTVTAADLLLHVLGRTTPTSYPLAQWNGVPSGAPVVLYVDDSGAGTPAFGFQTGSLPLTSPPAYRYVVFSGTITITTISGASTTTAASSYAPTPGTPTGTDPGSSYSPPAGSSAPYVGEDLS